MRIDLSLQPPTGAVGPQLFEVKTMGFCKSQYHVRWHACGRSWADFRARDAVAERAAQAAVLDTGLFKGVQPPPMATAMEQMGGIRALVVGGCCELNTVAHELIVEIGAERGARNAAESGEDIRQCTALEVQQLRQRLAVSIWRDYHNHINARMKYADPSADDRYRNEDEAEEEDEVQRERGERTYNTAWNQRLGRPQEFGL